MEALRNRILEEGQCLGGGILKVDGFVNHRVDGTLMAGCVKLADIFRENRYYPHRRISGIAPALMTASSLNLCVVYARKKRPVTMP